MEWLDELLAKRRRELAEWEAAQVARQRAAAEAFWSKAALEAARGFVK